MERSVEVSDWDKLVQETYSKPYYCFQQQDDCKPRGNEYFEVPMAEGEAETYDFPQDSVPIIVNGKEMGVSFKAWLARDPKEKFFERDFEDRLFWQRNFYPSLEMLANDLYKRGLIEAGDYTICIDW